MLVTKLHSRQTTSYQLKATNINSGAQHHASAAHHSRQQSGGSQASSSSSSYSKHHTMGASSSVSLASTAAAANDFHNGLQSQQQTHVLSESSVTNLPSIGEHVSNSSSPSKQRARSKSSATMGQQYHGLEQQQQKDNFTFEMAQKNLARNHRGMGSQTMQLNGGNAMSHSQMRATLPASSLAKKYSAEGLVGLRGMQDIGSNNGLYHHSNNRSEHSIFDETEAVHYYNGGVSSNGASLGSGSTLRHHAASLKNQQGCEKRRKYFTGMGTTSTATRAAADDGKTVEGLPSVAASGGGNGGMYDRSNPTNTHNLHASTNGGQSYNHHKSKKRPFIRKLETDSSNHYQYSNNMMIMNNQGVPIAFTSPTPNTALSSSSGNASNVLGVPNPGSQLNYHFPKLGRLGYQKRRNQTEQYTGAISGLTKMAAKHWNATTMLPHMSAPQSQNACLASSMRSFVPSVNQPHPQNRGNERDLHSSAMESTPVSQQRLSIVVPGDRLLSSHIPPTQPQTHHIAFDSLKSPQQGQSSRIQHPSAKNERIQSAIWNHAADSYNSEQKENHRLHHESHHSSRKRKHADHSVHHHQKKSHSTNSESHYPNTIPPSASHNDDSDSVHSASTFSRQCMLPDKFDLCSPSAVYESWNVNDPGDTAPLCDISSFNIPQKALLLKIHEELDALDQFLEEQKRLKTPKKKDPYDILGSGAKKTKHIVVDEEE
mmetsp:Transcript_5810/g.22045  ORF Transcript_5810/g.22045 Transcript_5810/m.22045 type:complete len:712 (-) Transcript_5810:1687-3822(-)|eukprot:CAMPEP_0117450184 /NCGR_PEP_ID=MMETSP0759-20121206/8333_1 /TAXON_ID=63605 /ORGANISM="Percolomonas cosmopolitus, Strain WS" /LENGTH=711 /DNA_ID=CAMNT_0005242689 /DNA_START=444 /DNA_END=2579 /DNA_ORIENTATION=-